MKRFLFSTCLSLATAPAVWGQTLPPGTAPGLVVPADLRPTSLRSGAGLEETITRVDHEVVGSGARDVWHGGGDPNHGAPRARFSAEYLLWWLRPMSINTPLLTSGPVVTGDPLTSSGPLGGPGTVVIADEDALEHDAFTGGRWTAEIATRSGWSLQISGFVLEHRTAGNSVRSDAGGSPILARPAFDVINNQESAFLISYPGALTGGAAIDSGARFWGFETNVLACSDNGGLQWLGGFRYLDLNESLRIQQSSTLLIDGAAFLNGFQLDTGDTVVVRDNFLTRNQFYGLNLGVQGERDYGGFTVGFVAKLGLGWMRQATEITGASALFEPGLTTPSDTANGGALALRTNSGQRERYDFAVVPELNLNVSRQLTSHVRAFAGYTFLYASSVVRPGDQIDRAVNVGHAPTSQAFNTIATPLRPANPFDRTDFWAHGINFGLELRY